MDRVSIERMCAGKEFQVEGADTEKAREEKLLVIPAGLVRRFVLEECKENVQCTWKTLHTSQPLYLSEHISHYLPTRSLRSSNTNLLTRPAQRYY